MKSEKLLLVLLTLLLFNTSKITAQWEPTGFTQSTWVLLQTENGNLLAADDIYPDMGGIYLSQDEGESWVKTGAEDHAYTSHLLKDGSIYLGGVECNMAISRDNGATWLNVNFKELFPGVSEFNPIYAIEYHNDRIYAAVLNFGVVYSDDNGLTWNLTDRDSLLDPNDPENGGQWCYNLRSYNGKLYNIGAFGIWEYDEDEDLWANIDDRWYASSSLIVDDVLYVNYNASGIPDGVRYTTDLQSWEVMSIPEGVSTSIRFLEYYRGAFFMGHVDDAVFYTLDHGDTWIDYREDFPAFSPVPGVDFYGVPMSFVFSEETIFCGVFSGFEDVGGVFKAPVPDDVLGVNNTPALFQPVVYPNPASDFVSLQLPKGFESQGSLMITDVLGRVQYNKTIGNQGGDVITVSTKSWASGLYIYKLEMGGSISSGKFLVE